MDDEGIFLADLNLSAVTDREQLTELLRTVHARADSPSYRAMAKWAINHGKSLPPSTTGDIFAGKFPRKDKMLAPLEACGVPAAGLRPWREAWERIAASERRRAAEERAGLDQQSARMLEEADAEATALIQKASTRAAKIIADAEAEANDRAAKIIAHAEAEANDRANNIVLAAKEAAFGFFGEPDQPDQPEQPSTRTPSDAVKLAYQEGKDFGEAVRRDAPKSWLEAVVARKPRMPSDLEARLLQGCSLPIDALLHDDVRHALRRGFWDQLEHTRA